ncbi:MAG: Nif11-like leader peptide family natural product precursor [Chlorobium sp.]|uniref:Nif11-like leader peptide family natural product precursor n=1 Tax=Chlorobium sp. TaxID=1095 RepID=UPI001DDDB733|nr:Nif11-like leader peptide family natural product precursor [Chlorobium sp.]MBN1279173.1 Nif11-like leader peptide family natural product precursor [Chlorobiaceae bacterium]MCF8216378.1 Nif11-like leader peptide family natural product precursor [Chlorobium sp.]MCF8271281.1 Nif11-like leader peptide family natural product precursor [Chlorobium sp.]MCF8287655.1 Nif11-like leader peptide family natural product precursor [Chlorobium sp.]MCF8291218.1 Nif11-like leader peptide family natural produ
MSTESAKEFLAKLIEDEGFRRSLVRQLSDKRRELIESAGYSFTEQELEEVKAGLPPGALGHVAGWFCDVEDENAAFRGRRCGGGLWH